MTARATPPGATDRLEQMVRELLGEQRSLTAVERFSQSAAQHRPALEPVYRSLIPLAAPAPGEQYGFEVDLDACSGCKSCVAACHALNGLEESESWREVGTLIGAVDGRPARGTGAAAVHPIQQTITTACHHCVEPACLDGCPVLAYDKDPLTGIVRHLDDQCIGCGYCILKCPYEAPKYSARLGIVRKCDMCHGRLAAGEAPACVQACPSSAIRITTVSTKWAAIQFRSPAGAGAERPEVWLPDSPDPAYTLPTTRFVTKHGWRDLRSADGGRPKPQPAHWPLVVMLVLSQAGAGLLVAASLPATSISPRARAGIAVAAWLSLHAGLVASIAHLGRPLGAWRAFLGWRTSWMSREILAFGLFSSLATLAAGSMLPELGWGWPGARLPTVAGGPALWAAALAGVAAVYTSAMIYVDTRRPSWRAGWTFPRFYGAATSLGLLGAGALWCGIEPQRAAMATAMAGLGAGALGLLAWWERRVMNAALAAPADPAHDGARLESVHFAPLRRARSATALLCLLGCAVALLRPAEARSGWLLAAAAAAFASTFAERLLFFRAANVRKMPGHAA